MALATLGGGCFWCLEAVFEQLIGVRSVTSGYMGGHVAFPSYEAVCSGMTGHAEVVQLDFDEETIGYERILEVFFAVHDPTTLDRQGGDIGSQYRSVVFHHDETQRLATEAMIHALQDEKVFRSPIVTKVEAAGKFFVAEEYHQYYFRQNPVQPYCAYVVAPKVAKFRERFAGWIKPAYR